MRPIISKKFYFIRHAQTDANAQELMCGGGWDIPLNEVGIEQAKKARFALDKVGQEIHQAYVSPMQRTMMTAEFINTNLSLPIEIVEGLKEWCVGDWEKQPWSDVPNPFNTTVDPPNGETREEFELRVTNSVNHCLEKSSDDTVLFVSHGAVAHALFTFMGVDTPKIKNATLYVLTPAQNHWTLKEVF